MDAGAAAGITGSIVAVAGFFGLSGHLSLRSTVEEVHEAVHPNHGTSFRDEVLAAVKGVGETAQEAATSAALAAQRAESVGEAVDALAVRQGTTERALAKHIGYHEGARI